MIIKILGGGCAKCGKLEEMARDSAAELNVTAEFIKVKDMNLISDYDILGTPALVIDEEVVCSGRLPRREQVTAWIQAAA